ncbi:MAG: hypothetical protein K0S32_23 [Bacteroidetes bacterium]|jgi:hypothetical protein|nr:hypothetical protein [Bacteroidota bacterium]
MRTLILAMIGICLLSFLKPGPEEIIIWQQDKPLAWSDFRGKPEKRNSIASTHYSLKRNVTNHGTYASVKIYAVFYPNESWKRRRKKNVLQHEQLHFDIVELYARKFRKQIQAETFKNVEELKEKLEIYHNKIDKELDVYQDQYDRATNHSRNSKRQAKWNSKIIVELDELREYKVNVVEVRFSY